MPEDGATAKGFSAPVPLVLHRRIIPEAGDDLRCSSATPVESTSNSRRGWTGDHHFRGSDRHVAATLLAAERTMTPFGPVLTAAARGALLDEGRDEETALHSQTKKLPRLIRTLESPMIFSSTLYLVGGLVVWVLLAVPPLIAGALGYKRRVAILWAAIVVGFLAISPFLHSARYITLQYLQETYPPFFAWISTFGFAVSLAIFFLAHWVGMKCRMMFFRFTRSSS